VNVRPTLSESRLASFEDVPFPKDDALLRLAPITLDKIQLKTVFEKAYKTRSISFASLLGKAFHGSVHFALESIDKESPCCICHEMPAEQRTITLCGHTYCHDCSLHVFAESIRNPQKVSECPYCREWLTCGDIFTIGAPAKTLCFCSKQLGIVPKTTIIDEEGLLGSKDLFVPSEKYSIVSVLDVDTLVQKILEHATSVPSIKVVLLCSPKDSYVEEFLSYF
jgi:hypothetical protein